jgi:hypothetical protein
LPELAFRVGPPAEEGLFDDRAAVLEAERHPRARAGQRDEPDGGPADGTTELPAIAGAERPHRTPDVSHRSRAVGSAHLDARRGLAQRDRHERERRGCVAAPELSEGVAPRASEPTGAQHAGVVVAHRHAADEVVGRVAHAAACSEREHRDEREATHEIEWR